MPHEDIAQQFVLPNALTFNANVCKDAFAADLDKAHSLCLKPVFSNERLSGNPHSGGYDSKEIACRLAQVYPDGKVLIVIREQKKIIRSVYTQYVRGMGSSSLKEYLAPSYKNQKKCPHFEFDHFSYHHLIQHYCDVFGKQNVLVLAYEQFRENNAGFLSAVSVFAGNTTAISKRCLSRTKKRNNASFSHPRCVIKRRLNPFLMKDHDNLGRMFYIPGLAWLIAPALWMTDRLTSRKLDKFFDRKYQEIIAEAVGTRYRESNRITAELTGLNLRDYGYDI